MPVLSDPNQWKELLPRVVEGGAKVLTGIALVAAVVVAVRPPASSRVPVSVRTDDRSEAQTPPLAEFKKTILGRALIRGAAPAPVARKPAPPPVPSAPPPPPKPTLSETAAEWSLVGIANTEGLQAILSNKKTKETVYATVGQQLGDMTVKAIEDASVTLSRDGETTQLKM
jgi:hypothetical protein